MASQKNSYLSKEQIESITEDISKLLATQTINGFKKLINIKDLNNRLKEIGKIIEEQAEIYYTDQKRNIEALRYRYTTEKFIEETVDGKKIKTNKERERSQYFNGDFSIERNKEQLMASLGEGYLLIMLLRQALLGEKIHYHIYIGNDFGDVQAITLNDLQLLELMNFSNIKTKINIGQKEIEEIEKIIQKDNNKAGAKRTLRDMEERTKAFRDFFSKIIKNDFDEINSSGQKKYKIKHSIIDNDKIISDSIKMQLFKKETKDIYDHTTRTRAAFNRGHLAEAFDIAYDSIVKVGKQAYNYDALRYPPFYKNLYYDNVKATKGGDNAVLLMEQYSVKAFGADLYNVSTLYGDLIELTTMIDLALNGNKEQEDKAKKHLENMFFSNEKYENALDNQCGKTVDMALDQAFGSLLKSSGKRIRKS